MVIKYRDGLEIKQAKIDGTIRQDLKIYIFKKMYGLTDGTARQLYSDFDDIEVFMEQLINECRIDTGRFIKEYLGL